MDRRGAGPPADLDEASLAQHHGRRAEHDRAIELGLRCLDLAEARGHAGLRAAGLVALCRAYRATGRSTECATRAHELVRALEGTGALERFGLSELPYAAACALAAQAQADLGDARGAMALLDRGQRAAEAAGHVESRMAVAVARAYVLAAGGGPADAIAHLEAAISTCREQRCLGALVDALAHLGRALVSAGRAAEAVPLLEESIALQDAAGIVAERTLRYLGLAEAHLALADLAAAANDLAAVFELAEHSGERAWEGWARLAEAELHRRRGHRGPAEEALDAAQDIADELGMMRLIERCRAEARMLR